MNRRQLLTAGGGVLLRAKGLRLLGDVCSPAWPDIRSVPADLITPAVSIGSPGPGQRVRQVLPKYAATAVRHNIYLPTDWRPNTKYPVLVEYPGNGPYTSPCGDFSSGDVDGCNLGYGISGGQGFIWVGLPFIADSGQQNQLWWWGDVQATIEYCREAVALVCEQFGGDAEAVILCGFSRGAIACNFIGLHDDVIGAVWLGFIASSHYDGVKRWDWAGSDRASAQKRLTRLKGRASFIAQELSTQNIQDYLRTSGADDPFTFQTIHFHNHTDAWVLRDIPERRALRLWVDNLLNRRLEKM
jgi:predicted esterase